MNADFSHTCEGCEHVVTEPSSIFSISIKDFGKKKRTLSSRPTFKSTVSLQYAQT